MKNVRGKITIETEDNQIITGTIDLKSAINLEASKLVLYNDIPVIMKWALFLFDGTKVYESGNYAKLETCKVDLDALNLKAGEYLKLKAIVAGGADKYGDIDIHYVPTSNTMYFGFYEEDGFDRRVEYWGTVESIQVPPVLKCAGVRAYHEGAVRMRWKFINDGSVKYSSGVQTSGDKWYIDLDVVGVAPGTKLTVKASVVGGADSTGYIVLEYDPASRNNAVLIFSGNAFKTVVMLADIGTHY